MSMDTFLPVAFHSFFSFFFTTGMEKVASGWRVRISEDIRYQRSLMTVYKRSRIFIKSLPRWFFPPRLHSSLLLQSQEPQKLSCHQLPSSSFVPLVWFRRFC